MTDLAPIAPPRSPTFAARLKAIWPDLIVYILALINTVRLFRHPMWRDELQDWMIASASTDPLDLFARLKYEGHPGLWHLLLWVITRFTTDPVWMQVAHLCIALSIWMLIWRAAPFGKIEKLLLVLSYFLFWEYFVVSRSYAIGVLLGLGFVASRTRDLEQRFWPLILLGLLANSSVFGAIWAIGMGIFFAGGNWRHWRSMLPGAVLCGVLFILAVATMIPAPGNQFAAFEPRLRLGGLDQLLRFAIGAFVPLFQPFLGMILNWIGGGGAALATTPFGDPVQQLYVLAGGGGSNQLAVVAALTVPIILCWSIVRDRTLALEFAVTYVGILLFAQLSQYPFTPRHYGFVFLALIGVVWMGRSAVPPRRFMIAVWFALLAINAAGGVTTLSAGLRPFSQSRNVATWIERHHLEDAFIMGAQDYAASPIAGYLQRPLYYLNCECLGTYIEWSARRKHSLEPAEIVARAARAMTANHQSEAYLIVNNPGPLIGQNSVPELDFEPLKRFSGAIKTDETYSVYRITARAKN